MHYAVIQLSLYFKMINFLVNNCDTDDNPQTLRPAYIPEMVLAKRRGEVPESVRKLERDMELELGDDYVLDLKKHYDLPNLEDR